MCGGAGCYAERISIHALLAESDMGLDGRFKL